MLTTVSMEAVVVFVLLFILDFLFFLCILFQKLKDCQLFNLPLYPHDNQHYYKRGTNSKLTKPKWPTGCSDRLFTK